MATKPLQILLFGRSMQIGQSLQHALNPTYILTQFTTLPEILTQLQTRHASYNGVLIGGGIDEDSRAKVVEECKGVGIRVVAVPPGFARDVGMENIGSKTKEMLDREFLIEGKM
ncbi:hypothetical protein HK097_005116 [Rhizophlyctis rosea]|uniref:Uncharacterized protein n=1 Tax=Rhizophlyctis rosea TaxID=64517 RepID=A0AAD5SF53_9FUNG|nr:hypothetical protein HK097_005116 [Rhizophlyctis rosea]